MHICFVDVNKHNKHIIVVRRSLAMNSPSASVLTFQCATAAMAGGAALSLASCLALPALSACLSFSICTVAYINYSSMATTRLRTVKVCEKKRKTGGCGGGVWNAMQEDDFAITCLRYSDWIVTMPLLALELLALARDGPVALPEGFLTWTQLDAFVAFLAFSMILCGLVALLAFEDFNTCGKDTGTVACMRWLLYFTGVACLVGIYTILFSVSDASVSDHWVEVYGFSLTWTLYPIAFVAQMLGLEGARKDIVYTVLDIISKPLLAVYVAVASSRV